MPAAGGEHILLSTQLSKYSELFTQFFSLPLKKKKKIQGHHLTAVRMSKGKGGVALVNSGLISSILDHHLLFSASMLSSVFDKLAFAYLGPC